MTIHGVIQDGAILPLEPLPAEWINGQVVVIESEGEAPVSAEERARIEACYDRLEALGPAEYEPGEREAMEKLMADADREAKEYVIQSWAACNDAVSAGHKPPERRNQP